MPTTTTDQQITIPVGADLADVVAMMASAIADIQTRLNLRYANAADRTARHPVPIEGESSDLAAENWADSFDGANWISRTARGYRAYRVRTTDAAAINNNTALQNDAVLVAPIESAGVFVFGGEVFYDASAASDFKMAFTWPGLPTVSTWGVLGRDAATTTNITAPVATASGASQALGAVGVGTRTWATYRGVLVNTGVAGNLQMQYAQQALDPTDLRVRAGSSLWVLRVP